MNHDAAFENLPDTISLREHVIEAEIGVFSDEYGVTQRLIFNVVVEVRSDPDPVEDDIDRILSYDVIDRAIRDALAERRVELLETLAEAIADRLLSHPRAGRVRIRIEKPDRVSGRLGIEIVRTEPSRPVAVVEGPRPQVFCLAESAFMARWFPAWVAALPAGPVALAVEGARLEGNDRATRHIRFLASETAAWAMLPAVQAADVVASRAELFHCFVTGKRAIWAPSRMIFASKDLAPEILGDFGRAVGWFAAEMGASRLTFVGRPVPQGLTFGGPVESVMPGE